MNASQLSAALADHAEAVCRHYLPAGRKQGRYWICGDVQGAPGKSLHVRLAPPGRPGKWTDEATGEHGDLLDLIRESIRASELRDAIVEAHRFLSLPLRPFPSPDTHRGGKRTDTTQASRAIWRQSRPIQHSHGAAYLRARGIPFCAYPTLRFHHRLNHRDDRGLRRFPAIVAAVVDNSGQLTGIHRTWLHPTEPRKAPLDNPRKALGHLSGHAVRFNRCPPGGILVAGEGLETVLSIVTALPGLAAAAALSAAHLSAFRPPDDLGLLVVAADNDDEGKLAAHRLARRCIDTVCHARVILPAHGDFNDDLRKRGPHALATAILPALEPE